MRRIGHSASRSLNVSSHGLLFPSSTMSLNSSFYTKCSAPIKLSDTAFIPRRSISNSSFALCNYKNLLIIHDHNKAVYRSKGVIMSMGAPAAFCRAFSNSKDASDFKFNSKSRRTLDQQMPLHYQRPTGTRLPPKRSAKQILLTIKENLYRIPPFGWVLFFFVAVTVSLNVDASKSQRKERREQLVSAWKQEHQKLITPGQDTGSAAAAADSEAH